MSEFAGYVAIITTVLGGVFGVGKVLLTIHRKDQEKLQKQKNEQFDKELRKLDERFGEYTKSLNNHALKIERLTGSIEKVYLRYDAQTDSIKTVHTELKEVSKDIHANMKSINTVVIQLSQDMAIYKSKKIVQK